MAEYFDSEIPHYFLCPISLEIMKDPVTVPTGITYDRDSIEKWLFSGDNTATAAATCPVTKQPIIDLDLTPNITLRRVIQSWSAEHGGQRPPTPKPAVTKYDISKTLRSAKSPEMQIKYLRKIRSISSSNLSNRRVIEAAGAVEFLASLITYHDISIETRNEALCILFSLHLSPTSLSSLNTLDFISSLTNSMETGNFETRERSTTLLNQILNQPDPKPSVLSELKPRFFIELARFLFDRISVKAYKSALQVLIITSPWGRNRIKAVEAGIVHILIELLLSNYTPDKRVSEMILMLLDVLCQCAEGRAQLLAHGAGLAVVSKKILRVSTLASERAVKILHSIARFSATPGVLQEMLQIGVVAKLSIVIQVDLGSKTKSRSWEIMKIGAKAWRSSPCFPEKLISLIPS